MYCNQCGCPCVLNDYLKWCAECITKWYAVRIIKTPEGNTDDR